MRWFGSNKKPQRFYLLPGMGGRALRRKHRVFLGGSIACGLVVSALVAYFLYMISSR